MERYSIDEIMLNTRFAITTYDTLVELQYVYFTETKNFYLRYYTIPEVVPVNESADAIHHIARVDIHRKLRKDKYKIIESRVIGDCYGKRTFAELILQDIARK